MQKASILGSALVGLVCLVMFTALLTAGEAREYRRYDSPDKRHALVVYREQQIFAFPGQSSDSPGYVVLLGAEGTELKRRSVDMVQLVTAPVWKSESVSVKLLLDWKR
ncbi:MAG: hypothetical protein AAF346_05190 [Pseudomonadota bacterium]